MRAVVHVHGAKTPPHSDGYPSDWYPPGRSFISYYPNHQDAATLWYHDHAQGLTRLNQYAGLIGRSRIRDDAEAALNLPQGGYEVPLLLCDRQLDEHAQLLYPTSGFPDAPWVPEFYGDAHLVNGKLFPYLEVEPCRYRLRLLNASNSRFYYLSLSNGQHFYAIGTDQGLLSEPTAVTSLTLAPAERADLIVDFSEVAGQKVVLQSQTFEVYAVSRRSESPIPAGAAAENIAQSNTTISSCRSQDAPAYAQRVLGSENQDETDAHQWCAVC